MVRGGFLNHLYIDKPLFVVARLRSAPVQPRQPLHEQSMDIAFFGALLIYWIRLVVLLLREVVTSKLHLRRYVFVGLQFLNLVFGERIQTIVFLVSLLYTVHSCLYTAGFCGYDCK